LSDIQSIWKYQKDRLGNWMGPTLAKAKPVSSLIHCPDESKASQPQNETYLQHYQDA
jgi:hypothetical protein